MIYIESETRNSLPIISEIGVVESSPIRPISPPLSPQFSPHLNSTRKRCLLSLFNFLLFLSHSFQIQVVCGVVVTTGRSA